MFYFNRKRVLVALSGGVDSAVAAALLIEEGYEVAGITFQLWSEKVPEPPDALPSHCYARKAVDEARRIAGMMGIPHELADLREAFEEKVVNFFTREYGLGRTPNPCVICNRKIKFAALLQKALQLKCSYIATGHYARAEYCRERGRYLLKKGLDAAKDQSYVLYNLTQEQLERCLFPLGGMTKEEVRSRARKLGLPVAGKKDSQEICFIPDNDYRAFLKRRGIKEAPGDIVNRKGEILGRHRGIAFYTVGQRRGLGLAAPRPLYVLEIRPCDNTIVVGEREELYRKGAELSGLNLIALSSLEHEMEVTAKIRYGAPEVPAIISPLQHEHQRARLIFARPQAAVAPGQAAVFYRGDLVIGGGTITAAV